MSGYFDILILFVVVLVIFKRLHSILGSNADSVNKAKAAEENAARIFDIIMKEAEKNQMAEMSRGEDEAESQESLSDTEKVLRQIPNFDEDKFLYGAKKAFEMIVASFSKGDIETLEMLVSKKLLKKFQDIIEQRKAEGIVSEADFIGFDKAEIVKAKVSADNIAKITVEFISQQVNLLKNAEGEVIEGDENFIQNISDTWTFERALTSTNPNWLLVSTRK
ncbi:MAG: Tim44 domain-containing protein [Alphaproteobacteria bacterium]|nr:Tim44 domain-containing protein [Alphaproteobacteria bacterium]